MSELDLRRFRKEQPDPQRKNLYRRAVLVGIGGNALLAMAKGVVAWVSGSSAVLSDAVNSLSDTLYSLLMGAGLYVAQQPPDESHPQGHYRVEPLVSLFIAGAMGVAGGAALRQSIQHLIRGPEAIEAGWPTVVLVGAVLIKVVMYLVVKRIGQEVHSPAIWASARDNLADVLTSGAALAGVWGSRWIHPLFDPVAGIIVALWVFRAAGQVAWENLGYLTGRGAPTELIAQIAAIGSGVDGVDDVHRVIADYVGPQFRVDMHINVNGEITLEQAHEIAEAVRARVEALQEVDQAFVHVEPTLAHGMHSRPQD